MPESGNPSAWDRYAYAYNNPIKYNDPSGHCPFCIVVGIGFVILKVVDYGWTAWDSYQSAKVIGDANSSPSEKILAATNIGLAVTLEAIEPDDLLPTGLPLDDAARKALLSGAREAFEEGGTEAFEKFIREALGDFADDVFKQLDEVIGLGEVKFLENPGQLGHIFRDASGHFAKDTLENRNLLLDTISWNNYKHTDEFGNQIFASILDDGSEVWVYIRDGIIQDGGLNTVPRW